MKAKEILNHKKHRAFNYPKRPWVFYQEWNDALFMHWQIDPNAIQPLLPKGLKVDTINNKTWISIVAFDMNNIGIRNIPKMPHISDFHEINIRVYITCNNKPSVYFLSMEGSKKSSCTVLKAVSKFPYHYSKMKRNAFSYTSENINRGESFYTEYRLGDFLNTKDDIDYWLTERYAVFQDHKKAIIEYDVHHLEWPIQQITIKKLEVNYPRFSHLINNAPDRVHYSKGVQVITWDKKKLAL